MDLLNSIEGRHYLINILTDYLSENHVQEIENMITESFSRPKEQLKSFVLRIDVMVLLQKYPWISSYLLNDAIKLLKLFNAGFTKLICSVSKKIKISIDSDCIIRCFIRITSLPICEEISRTSIPKSEDVGKFLSVSATVVRAGTIQVLEYEREYRCKKCKFSFICEFSESDATYTINSPKCCPNSISGCISNSFELANSSQLFGQRCKNRQEIHVQEQIKFINFGCMPRTMKVILDDDLVDLIKPGDDVIINGTVIRRWKKQRIGEECEIQLVILANEIQIINHTMSNNHIVNSEIKHEFHQFWDGYKDVPFSGRNAIISQICPSIYGMYFLKLSLALLLSGSGQCFFNGIKVRGESHLLLVGDPGTAKSQFLKFAHKMTPRSVLTTGIGSTNAGLTVTAVKEAGDWSLEAGALVLSDGGVCCIDEFTSIREADKMAIHEAMEQQSISVAKAGIVCKLKTRCSVIAATNPKGNYDVTQSITANTAIASPLLSRFDMIFLLLDNCNESWDKRVSDFILHRDQVEYPKESFSLDKLKSYFAFIRSNFHPKMSCEASLVLEKYYTWMRRSDTSDSLDRITMRFLESLIRLSQSHARLMMHNVVGEDDAIIAVAVMESTVYGSTVLSTDKQLPSAFPDDPEEEYRLLRLNICERLQIPISSVVCEKSVREPTGMTADPLIRRTGFDTLSSSIKIASRKKGHTLNKSVLDNFQLATQIDPVTSEMHRSFFESGPNDGAPDLIDQLLEEIEDKSNVQLSAAPTMVTEQKSDSGGRFGNIFADSMDNQRNLTDDDFNI